MLKVFMKKAMLIVLCFYVLFLHAAPVFAATITITHTPTNTTAYQKGNHTFSFTTQTSIADNGYFYIEFPTSFSFETGIDYTDVDFLVDGVQKTLIDGPSSGTNYGAYFYTTSTPKSLQIGIAPSGGAISAGAVIEVRVGTNATSGFTGDKQIINPSVNNAYTLAVKTYNQPDTLRDSGTATDTITGGWTVTDTLTDTTVSTASNHTFTFTASSTIPAGGLINIGFPTSFSRASGLDYTDVDFLVGGVQQSVAAAQSGSATSVSFQSQGSYEYLTLNLRTGSGISSGAAVIIRVGTNATEGVTGDKQYANASTATSYRFNVMITSSDMETTYDEDYSVVTLTAAVAAAPEFTDIMYGSTLLLSGWYMYNKFNKFKPQQV